MTELLSKLFIKNYDNINHPDVRKSYGTLASVVGICINLLLAGAKIAVGAISASTAMIADGLNNFSDAGASIVSFFSFKISSKPADRGHPFGHARMEYISSTTAFMLSSIFVSPLFKTSAVDLFKIAKSSIKRCNFTFPTRSVAIRVPPRSFARVLLRAPRYPRPSCS